MSANLWRRSATRTACLFAAVVLLGGCGDDGVTAPEAERQRALSTWRSMGLENYTVEVRVSCFCDPIVSNWHEITVDGGQVFSVRLVDTLGGRGSSGGPAEPSWYSTVDSLFERIGRQLQSQNGERVNATYDPLTGLPTRVSFLAPPNMADGDVTFELRALKPGLTQ